ncbi:hypothetical protein BV22DRAFT_1135392 [Leucogyrophana mollusca]|uniref:Uncharacterized protein n=1 Tax=Leucogyrophana mollusca TaxID=85980 RepID=A0ACB8AVR1_9AGAM|nr:hypothetical protein BV22DRAFT_1135392 [Leucogyrophana mollusca]
MSLMAAQQTPVNRTASDSAGDSMDRYTSYAGTTYDRGDQWASQPAPFGSYQSSGWAMEPQAIASHGDVQPPIHSENYYSDGASTNDLQTASSVDPMILPNPDFAPEQPIDPQDDDACYERAANEDEGLFQLPGLPASSMISSQRLSLPTPRTSTNARRTQVTSPSPSMVPAKRSAAIRRAPLSRLTQSSPNTSVLPRRDLPQPGCITPSLNTQAGNPSMSLHSHHGNQENISPFTSHNSHNPPSHSDDDDVHNDDNDSDCEQLPLRKKNKTRERSTGGGIFSLQV